MIELAKRQFFHGVRFDGRTYDCGSKLGFLNANIAFALEREDLGPALRAELKKLGAVGFERALSAAARRPSMKTSAT